MSLCVTTLTPSLHDASCLQEQGCAVVQAGRRERHVLPASPVDSGPGAASCHHRHLCQQGVRHPEGQDQQLVTAVS